jgi:hypothetical protein
MSRRPGIAADWFAKYYEDVYPSDSIYAGYIGRRLKGKVTNKAMTHAPAFSQYI